MKCTDQHNILKEIAKSLFTPHVLGCIGMDKADFCTLPCLGCSGSELGGNSFGKQSPNRHI